MKDLLRKGFLICLLVLVAGAFISCGGNNDGTGGGDSVKYEIKYKTYTLLSAEGDKAITQDDVDEFTTEGGFTSADYSISGNTITLTDSGLDKFLSIMSEEMSEELGEEMGGAITYLAAYDNEIVMYLNDMLFTFYGSLLEEDTDYIIDGKIIVLTDAGYAKVTNLPGEN